MNEPTAPQASPMILRAHSDTERSKRAGFARLLRSVAMPEEELLANLGMFIRRQEWSRYMFLHHLYQLAVPVHGVVMEFGCRWGQNLALFSAFRGMYEPYNYTRKVIGFDTFAGFPSVAAEDGTDAIIEPGAYSVTEGWEATLAEILAYQESESPISHIRKFELIKGDVSETLPAYLTRHPEVVVALAYFDLDLYKPTRDALVALQPHLTRGSVLGFDEVGLEQMPGETVALREVLGLDRVRLQRVPNSPLTSFFVWEG